MDMTPVVLIFTPIFLPIAQELGMDPVHFRYYDGGQPFCIGLLTPPVGGALFCWLFYLGEDSTFNQTIAAILCHC